MTPLLGRLMAAGLGLALVSGLAVATGSGQEERRPDAPPAPPRPEGRIPDPRPDEEREIARLERRIRAELIEVELNALRDALSELVRMRVRGQVDPEASAGPEARQRFQEANERLQRRIFELARELAELRGHDEPRPRPEPDLEPIRDEITKRFVEARKKMEEARKKIEEARKKMEERRERVLDDRPGLIDPLFPPRGVGERGLEGRPFAAMLEQRLERIEAKLDELLERVGSASRSDSPEAPGSPRVRQMERKKAQEAEKKEREAEKKEREAEKKKREAEKKEAEPVERAASRIQQLFESEGPRLQLDPDAVGQEIEKAVREVGEAIKKIESEIEVKIKSVDLPAFKKDAPAPPNPSESPQTEPPSTAEPPSVK